MSQTQTMFAYGRDEINECTCPAVTAGYEPASGDNSLTPAEQYDEQIERLGFATDLKGVVSEDQAKRAWLSMLNRMKTQEISGHKVAEEIAEELGWI
jgi:isopentenyl phosphate kinase